MRNILMSVAAIALAAGGAYAQPGNGNGNGKNNGGGNAAAAAKQGGGNKSQGNGGGNAKANGGGNGAVKAASVNRGNGGGNGNSGNGAAKAVKAADNRGNGNGNGNSGNNGNSGRDYVTVKNNGNGNGKAVNVRNVPGRVDRGDDDFIRYTRWDSRARDYGLIDGCPPGLAKKNNGCNPPGLVKRDYYDYDRSSWWGLPGLIDGRYRYYDNNLVRIGSSGSILGYYPLLGGALSAGNIWPTWFDYEPVPSYYESYYGLGPTGSYRYADNVLYRVDPETAAISSIAALLTGDTIRVGQPMPSGYSVYNVPYGYRDRYYDSPNAMYRYSDGYVYEVDPTTMLVQSAIQLLI